MLVLQLNQKEGSPRYAKHILSMMIGLNPWGRRRYVAQCSPKATDQATTKKPSVRNASSLLGRSGTPRTFRQMGYSWLQIRCRQNPQKAAHGRCQRLKKTQQKRRQYKSQAKVLLGSTINTIKNDAFQTGHFEAKPPILRYPQNWSSELGKGENPSSFGLLKAPVYG